MTWLLNREEKEQYVVQLYKEGRSVREIAKQMHTSFRDIGDITNNVKLEVEREKGYITYVPEQEIDTEPKSKVSQAFKLFSEGKTPVEVVISLDLPADEVRAIYREFWELNGMYKLAQIYDEAKYDLHSLLRLYKIVKDLGMEEHEIINVLQLANSHHLELLQWKVEYLRNDIERLEVEKTKCNNHILNLNRIIDEFQGTLSMYESSLAQKRGEMTYMNQESVTYILSHTQNPELLHTSIRLLTHQ
ncbi:MAG: hypothetical protein WB988_12810 [Candidatus Nitrosopolaris sp.]